MGENDEENERQTMRVKVSKNATEEEKKAALGAAYFEEMKARLISEYEKRGIPLQDPDNMSIEEANNLSQALMQLKEKEEISSVASRNRQGEETTLWEANERGIAKSYRNYGNSGKEYSSQEDLIRDLRAQARDQRDPAKAAEAEAIITELYKKWGKQMHADFENGTRKSQVNYEPKEERDVKKKIRELQKEGA